jgi:hypothetical protein
LDVQCAEVFLEVVHVAGCGDGNIPFWILDFGFWINLASRDAGIGLVEVFAEYDRDFGGG